MGPGEVLATMLNLDLAKVAANEMSPEFAVHQYELADLLPRLHRGREIVGAMVSTGIYAERLRADKRILPYCTLSAYEDSVVEAGLLIGVSVATARWVSMVLRWGSILSYRVVRVPMPFWPEAP